MRFFFPLASAGLAIVLGLSFPTAGFGRQGSDSAQADQASTAPAAEGKTAEGGERRQTAAAAGNETKKRQKGTAAPDGSPRKVVVREGGASEPAEQIVPGMTPAESAHQRQNAEQWLSSTDAQLKQLAERKLNSQQEETMSQIHNYINGARVALHEGDLRRASTLAEKAHLLSDDLVKH